MTLEQAVDLRRARLIYVSEAMLGRSILILWLVSSEFLGDRSLPQYAREIRADRAAWVAGAARLPACAVGGNVGGERE
jgi:hypothetical protein